MAKKCIIQRIKNRSNFCHNIAGNLKLIGASFNINIYDGTGLKRIGC